MQRKTGYLSHIKHIGLFARRHGQEAARDPPEKAQVGRDDLSQARDHRYSDSK